MAPKIKIDPPEEFMVDAASGIKIPTDLSKNMAPVTDFIPNGWNPNHMDTFVKDRLIRSVKKDGFLIPLLVRPNPVPGGAKYQIIDGEHRWTIGGEAGMTSIPFTNLGPISDAAAKELTIKANTLHGDFDSVELALIVKELADSTGMAEVAADLPFSQDRLQSMIDLLQTDITNLTAPSGSAPSDEDGDDKQRNSSSKDFKSFDPSDMKFEHECPRCGFGYNPSEKKAGDLGKPRDEK